LNVRASPANTIERVQMRLDRRKLTRAGALLAMFALLTTAPVAIATAAPGHGGKPTVEREAIEVTFFDVCPSQVISGDRRESQVTCEQRICLSRPGNAGRITQRSLVQIQPAQREKSVGQRGCPRVPRHR
jgi:hypothetical protein